MKERSIWKMLVLSIVTLGIYQLYWYIQTRREMMQTDKSVKIMSPWFLLIPVLLVIFGMVLLIVSTPSFPTECQTQIDYSSAQTIDCRPDVQTGPITLFYVSILLAWPLTLIWLWQYSKGVDIVTKGQTSFAVALLVLILVPYGIDILIIQDSFNKLSAAPPAPPTENPAPSA